MAKKLVRRDKDTYNGAIWLDSENQAYGISYARGTIVIVDDGAGGNNAYTLLENVSGSQCVANSSVAPMGGGGGDILQEDPYSIKVESFGQYSETKWEPYQWYATAYIDDDNKSDITLAVGTSTIDVRGMGGVVQEYYDGNDFMTASGVWSVYAYDTTFTDYTGLFINKNGIIADNLTIAKITDDKSLITKEYIETAHSAVIIPPTSDPLVAGALWNNGGVLTISAG